MPRPAKPAHLWLMPEKRNDDGTVRQHATWYIKDGGRRVSTGCRASAIRDAEQALEDYLIERRVKVKPVLKRTADECLIADVLVHYFNHKGDVARPKELAARLRFLTGFWGDKTLADISRATCAEYAEHRGSTNSARRELEDLRSAVNMYAADSLCRDHVKVSMPTKPQSRVDYFTRDQVAALVWYLYRTRVRQGNKDTKAYALRHIVPFVLVAIYTGTRSKRVWQASFKREEGLPWIDVDDGVFYRAAQGESVSPTKRAGSIRIPPRLLLHLRRWAKTRDYLVEYRGAPADPKKALARAMDEVFGPDHPFVRHTFRHTAATWLMWTGGDIGEIAHFLSMSREILTKVYGHHHPDANKEVGEMFTRQAGRRKKAA
ncbi:integrase [Aurantimonas sp. HBX-1]|uniref:integrase n=1 Tax=Aurantimonas sp. HBX-1 TaxID=2906072 RepID=UPI001F1CEF90|nr:integrase [Aurantimonas sp. HBX-1]UIJ73480.1 integrase [Aurantimonas sp. HBX-1]